MAEKSEGGRPSDFFVGVVDFFAILLPGALLTFFLLQLDEAERICRWFAGLEEGVPRWTAFLIASYVLGHFIFAVGSFLLDELYDATYKLWFGGNADKLRNAAARALALEKTSESGPDAAKATATSPGAQNPEGNRRTGIRALPSDVGVLDWATAFVRVQSAAAAIEIDRAEAESKFFRSLITLQLLSWPLLFALGAKFQSETAATAPVPAEWWWRYAAVFLLLFVLKFKDGLLKLGRWVLDLNGEKTEDPHHGPKREQSSKLAASILYTALLTALVFFANWGPYSAIAKTAPVPVSYALLFLSVWRFMDTRLKRTKLTYEFALVLLKWPEPKSGELP